MSRSYQICFPPLLSLARPPEGLKAWRHLWPETWRGREAFSWNVSTFRVRICQNPFNIIQWLVTHSNHSIIRYILNLCESMLLYCLLVAFYTWCHGACCCSRSCSACLQETVEPTERRRFPTAWHEPIWCHDVSCMLHTRWMIPTKN